jgi:hypothetical protein
MNMSDNIIKFPARSASSVSEKNAFASIELIGQKAFRQRRRLGKLASVEDFVKANSRFRAWKRQDSIGKTMLWKEWDNHGVSARIAYGMVTSTQKKLVQMHEEMDPATVDEIMGNIYRSTEILKAAAQFMDLVLVRLVAAGSVVDARRKQPAGGTYETPPTIA